MPGPPRQESRRLRLCAAAAVALATFAVLVPANWVRWPISEDAIEYAAIARNWVAGRGFVNPVMLSFSLDDATPPVPGLATRAPVVSLLLSIPIALGASLRGLGIVHQAWAALVVAGLVLAARRSMSLPAAVACAVTFAWSTGWLAVTQPLVTEVSAVGAFLLVLVTARRAARSLPEALLCAALVWLAWLTRPPLGLLVPVVWLAHALEVGPRAALRSRPLWLYVGAAAGLYACVELGHRALTGYAPYAQYDVMLTSLDLPDVARYETLGGGAFEFVRTHGPEVRNALAANLRSLVRVLFTAEFYPPVGWLALPALAHALRRRDAAAFELRISALAGFVLLLPVLLVYGPGDPRRYSLSAVVALWIAQVGSLDALRAGLADRLRRGRRPAWARLASPAVLLAAAALFVAAWSLPRIVAVHAGFWRVYRERGFIARLSQWDGVARSLCPLFDRDAVVAAGPSPWGIHFWCGNPTLWTPNDLGSVASLHRFLTEHRPEYLLASRAEAARLMDRSPRLEHVAVRRDWVLYRVKEPFRPERRWAAPPPLHQLGGGAPLR